MLHCVVIGGGPTGVEFSGELSDFIVRDVYQRYQHVKNYVCVTLIEVIIGFIFIYLISCLLLTVNVQYVSLCFGNRRMKFCRLLMLGYVNMLQNT